MSLLIEIHLKNFRTVTDCYFGVDCDADIFSAISHMLCKFAGCFTMDDVLDIKTTLCPMDYD